MLLTNFQTTVYVDYIKELVEKGGPQPDQWPEYDGLIKSVVVAFLEKQISDEEFKSVRAAFGEAFSLKTLQGLSFIKPHGYAGDFEIIDKIYTYHISSEKRFRLWDEYYQAHECPRAVRNRKEYFKQWILSKYFESV